RPWPDLAGHARPCADDTGWRPELLGDPADRLALFKRPSKPLSEGQNQRVPRTQTICRTGRLREHRSSAAREKQSCDQFLNTPNMMSLLSVPESPARWPPLKSPRTVIGSSSWKPAAFLPILLAAGRWCTTSPTRHPRHPTRHSVATTCCRAIPASIP